MALDSGSKFGAGLLSAGMLCVLLLMLKLRGNWKLELICALFFAAQATNLWLILRGSSRRR
ncbi:MAG: hypothetical protein V4555_13910 [Acidobacteriota bacterium]